jgi:hypothetical protein
MVRRQSTATLKCHLDLIRLVHPHASTRALSLLSNHLCLCLSTLGFPRLQSTLIPDEDTAQVDMVQGLRLRIALVLPTGAHLLVDAADQGLRHTMIENRGEVQVLVINLLSLLAQALDMAPGSTLGLATLLSNHPQ